MAFGFTEGRTDSGDLKATELPKQDLADLPDDSGDIPYSADLPDDSGNENLHIPSVEDNPYYYDDNGKIYREGTELVKNGEYELNGYKYKTDHLGRIISALGQLRLKNRDGRLTIKDSIDDIGKGDQKEGDDRGHLIGDQFDGSSDLGNMIAQDPMRNRIDYKNFENELAREVRAGKEVFVKIDVLYDGDSRRPSNIVVTYTIDGETSVRIFPNNHKEN